MSARRVGVCVLHPGPISGRMEPDGVGQTARGTAVNNGTTYTVDVDGIQVVVTHKRVKNVNMRVGSDGQARVSVPVHMTRQQVEKTLQERADWFSQHVGKAEERKPLAPVHWETGERINVWGEEAVLRIEETLEGFGCSYADGVLLLQLSSAATANTRAAFVERWYQDELIAFLKPLLPKYEERMGVYTPSITVRRMKTRWGSCTRSSGRIRINTALAECPPKCAETVLVHELCHLLVSNHGPSFQALMDIHCPDWRVTQRWLDEHPPRA